MGGRGKDAGGGGKGKGQEAGGKAKGSGGKAKEGGEGKGGKQSVQGKFRALAREGAYERWQAEAAAAAKPEWHTRSQNRVPHYTEVDGAYVNWMPPGGTDGGNRWQQQQRGNAHRRAQTRSKSRDPALMWRVTCRPCLEGTSLAAVAAGRAAGAAGASGEAVGIPIYAWCWGPRKTKRCKDCNADFDYSQEVYEELEARVAQLIAEGVIVVEQSARQQPTAPTPLFGAADYRHDVHGPAAAGGKAAAPSPARLSPNDFVEAEREQAEELLSKLAKLQLQGKPSASKIPAGLKEQQLKAKKELTCDESSELIVAASQALRESERKRTGARENREWAETELARYKKIEEAADKEVQARKQTMQERSNKHEEKFGAGAAFNLPPP